MAVERPIPWVERSQATRSLRILGPLDFTMRIHARETYLSERACSGSKRRPSPVGSCSSLPWGHAIRPQCPTEMTRCHRVDCRSHVAELDLRPTPCSGRGVGVHHARRRDEPCPGVFCRHASDGPWTARLPRARDPRTRERRLHSGLCHRALHWRPRRVFSKERRRRDVHRPRWAVGEDAQAGERSRLGVGALYLFVSVYR